MSSKRAATRELNHENWNDEEESEEPGTFTIAPQEVLKKREFKTAKRRVTKMPESTSSTASLFGNFQGFSKASTSTPNFGFLANVKPLESKKDEANKSTNNSKDNGQSIDLTGNDQPAKIPDKNDTDKTVNQLTKLNNAVLEWIKNEIAENPNCILSPVFKDYEKHLSEIIQLKGPSTSIVAYSSNFTSSTSSTLTSKSESSTAKSNGLSALKTLKFSPTTMKDPEKKLDVVEKSAKETEKTETFAPFITPMKTAAFSSPATSKFASSSTSGSGASGFTFGNGDSFTFGSSTTSAPTFSFSNLPNIKKPSPPREKTDDESDEPPKVEITKVVEENSVYSVRCKLFQKKGSEYVDKGVGHIYVKPIEDSEKMQVIMRADTNLGNLLLNFVLSNSVTVTKGGKNNVFIVCIPTPGAKPPPSTMLVKVKTPEDADALIDVLNKHKK